ncbi:MAG: enoyl-CoA hydratase/isomerase family protein, partial [Pseudomonadales bacterium]
AFDLGIASTLTDSGAVDGTALGIAAEFAEKPPQAMRKTKVLLKGDRQQVLDRIRWEEQLLFGCFATAENEEALAALKEKRPPDFSTFS